jgi:CheY-like chemotaxis protein
MKNKLNILVIDDEQPLENIYTAFLQKIGANVTFYDHPQKGWHAIDKNQYDLIITDLKMPAITGDEFIKIVRDSKLNVLTPIIMCSAFINKLVLTEMGRESKVYFLNKPFDSKALLELVDKAVGSVEVEKQENTAQTERWLRNFTFKLNSLTNSQAEYHKIPNFEIWNYESVSITLFVEEDTGPISITLMMKTKTFLKIAGILQGTQYKNIEAETLSNWQQLLKGINKGTAKITCSKVLSQEILLMPSQATGFYRVTVGLEEILVYLN